MQPNLAGMTIKNYYIDKCIGAGTFGTVFRSIDLNTKNHVAMKVIPFSSIQSPKHLQFLQSEINILRSCDNPNVIKFVECFKTNYEIFIITQFCNGGDLENYLAKKTRLSEDEATQYLIQILNGFKGLHKNNSMHRDLKAANILLHDGVCKIADLGLAKQLSDPQGYTSTVVGTPYTMAPQILDRQPYGFKADIWSIGVVYYQLLSGKYPFQAKNQVDLKNKIKSGKINFWGVKISSEAKDFIQKCLTVDPKKRIEWLNIYNHPLISKLNDQIIIGPLKSRVFIDDNRRFYKNNQLQGKQNIQKKNIFHKYDGKMQQAKLNKDILKQAEQMNQKKECFKSFELKILKQRNNMMFFFHFIQLPLHQFSFIKANQEIAMFLMAKKALKDLKKLQNQLILKKNVFNFQRYFKEFTNHQMYQDIINQLRNDELIIQQQCESYISTIKENKMVLNKQIKDQFNLRQQISNDLAINMVKQTWFQLAVQIDSIKYKGEGQKERYIKLLAALNYYAGSKKIQIGQFEESIKNCDCQKLQGQIRSEMEKIFN